MIFMRISSCENAFHITGRLWGEYTGSPPKRARNMKLSSFFVINLNNLLNKQSSWWWFEMTWVYGDLRCYDSHSCTLNIKATDMSYKYLWHRNILIPHTITWYCKHKESAVVLKNWTALDDQTRCKMCYDKQNNIFLLWFRKVTSGLPWNGS